MLASVRLQRILALLRDNEAISTAELRQRLDVTAMTVWRDLRILEEQGLLRRVRGGARLRERGAGEPDFEAKDLRAADAKRRIAALAAREFVREGDTVAMEGGTTVAALVDYLPAERISVLTNSLPVAQRLRTLRPSLAVRVVGGWLSPVSGNTSGPEALRVVGGMRASVCFLGATAFDASFGPSDPNPLEIEVKRALASISRRVVLLVDSAKFSTPRSSAVMIHPKRLHALVTDAPPPPDVSRLFKANKTRVLIARQ